MDKHILHALLFLTLLLSVAWNNLVNASKLATNNGKRL